jgi:anti-sigma28 factor (negative regulator of flagellin synthesis)
MYAGDDKEESVRLPADQRAARDLTRKLREQGEARQTKVESIRKAIESEDYENPLKLSVTIDRLIDELR